MIRYNQNISSGHFKGKTGSSLCQRELDVTTFVGRQCLRYSLPINETTQHDFTFRRRTQDVFILERSDHNAAKRHVDAYVCTK